MVKVLSLSDTVPQLEFINKFSAGLKKFEENKEMMDTMDEAEAQEKMDDDNDENMDASQAIENKESETLQKDPEFRNWQTRARAVTSAIKMIEKFT